MAASTEPSNITMWLREVCAGYRFDVDALLRKQGRPIPWPITLTSESELWTLLETYGHTTGLPKESAALAHIIEVSLVDYLLVHLNALPQAICNRGTTRAYPDLDISAAPFGSGYHAVDIKAARLSRNGKSTGSQITLCTGNTYFKHPGQAYKNMFRPYGEYKSHLDLIVLFTFNANLPSRVTNLRILVHECWRIASRRRSSTTRRYIGAVTSVSRLAQGQGSFASEEAFYEYWRAYDWTRKAPKAQRDAQDPASIAAQDPANLDGPDPVLDAQLRLPI